MKERDLQRLNECKAHLSKYKSHEGEHEEGYDGHQEWNDEDKLLTDSIAFFYKAVKKRYYLEVRSFLGILLPNGPDDSRLQPIQRLLTNTPSEEALKEALLLAITTGSRPLVEFILALFIDCPYLERSGCFASANFPPHMTPLMLACILNNFPVVECLLLRGHTIQIPHFLDCECGVCRRQTVSTRTAQRLADVMRAISSEAYLWLATDDVIAAACHVARDLQHLMDTDELDQIEIYRTLEGNVQRFLAHVSNQAWRAEEFNVIAANKFYSSNSQLASPRLQMAMDSHMRHFTCSNNVQTTMKSVFRADWYNFGNKPKRDAWRTLRSTFLMPFLVILHTIIPSLGTTMAVPLGRMIAHVFSYLGFLTLVVARPTASYLWGDDAASVLTTIEVILFLYILGLVVEKIMLFNKTDGSFFAYWWRWFDFFLIGFFILTFACFAATLRRGEYYDPSASDRVHWVSFDPLLFHEIFFSISCVFAVSKCFYYLQLSTRIGGSIISVGKCVGKTYTYLLIMVIVIISFSVGLAILVNPYSNRKLLGPDGGSSGIATTDSYDNIGASSKNLFWSIFGYLGPSTYITVVGNTGHNMQPVNHYWNTATLEALGALYHGIIIITVLNLMTSLLVKKADEVLDNEELEFKYTRAAVYFEFLPWYMAAPPPLNLFLIPIHFIHRILRHFESPTWDKVVADSMSSRERKETEQIHTAYYMDLLQALFCRFTASKECKYRSIWRTEFEKEEKHNSHVLFMNGGVRHCPIDNTYEGWRWRKSRKMKLPAEQLFHGELVNNYEKKGTARAQVMLHNPQEEELMMMAGMKKTDPNETNVDMPAATPGAPEAPVARVVSMFGPKPPQAPPQSPAVPGNVTNFLTPQNNLAPKPQVPIAGPTGPNLV